MRICGDLSTKFFARKGPEIFLKYRHFPEKGYFSKTVFTFLRGALDAVFPWGEHWVYAQCPS